MGWQRHVTLAMLAQAYLGVVRAEVQGSPEGTVAGRLRCVTGGARRRAKLLPSTLLGVRRLLWSLAWRRHLAPVARIIAWSLWRRAHKPKRVIATGA